MRVLTCNIRCFGADDAHNHWEFRKEFCADIIRRQEPDIICFQEMWHEQSEFLQSKFPDYQHHCLCDEPESRRPMNSIFFRREKFRLLSAAGYWLSETPHIPGSKSWDSSCVRFCSWVGLEDLGTKGVLRILNTHLDHIGGTARKRQASLINEDAAVWPNDYPQILTGDMNADGTNIGEYASSGDWVAEEGPIWTFKQAGWRDSYETVHGQDYAGFSMHAFKGHAYESRSGRIDWILFRGALKPVATEFITDSKDGRFPSDHYFLRADFELGTGGLT